jgi:integrase
MSQSIDQLIAKENARLKSGGIRARIVAKGNSLFLRASVPPRPGTKSKRKNQASFEQDIATKLPATPAGLKDAFAKAIELGGKIATSTFDWNEYLLGKVNLSELKTVGECCRAFETNYWITHAQTPESLSTWKKHYAYVLKGLPQEEEALLSSDLIYQTIIATPANTCKRKNYCKVLEKLANFAKLKLDFNPKELQGNYSSLKPAPRHLPDDELIQERFKLLRKKSWRWAYGMEATYGLRPHELFHLDTSDLELGGDSIRVLSNTKTGERIVYPLYPEWIELFELRDVQVPQVTAPNNGDLGQRVSIQFWRAGIGFPPYHLRHAWAVRSLMVFGMDISIAARQMGHSVQIHSSIYHAWISDKQQEDYYQQMKNSPNRPKPPECT